MQRPTGITILAILALIGGIFGLFGALAVFGISTFYGSAVANVEGFGVASGVVALIYALFSLAVAYGFWTLQSWAWPVGIALGGLGILSAILQFMQPGSNVVGLIVSLGISLFILWYLFQPHVKGAFGRS